MTQENNQQPPNKGQVIAEDVTIKHDQGDTMFYVIIGIFAVTCLYLVYFLFSQGHSKVPLETDPISNLQLPETEFGKYLDLSKQYSDVIIEQ